jgi:uncharacterized membrane protein YkvA (DUF1232 family)
VTDQEKIREVHEKFLAHVLGAIKDVQEQEAMQGYGAEELTWKDYAAKIPGLTESVAMYFMMKDPNTDPMVAAYIAGALLYLISPLDIVPDTIPVVGVFDDAGVVFMAFKNVATNLRSEHVRQAEKWLREDHGIPVKPSRFLGKALELKELYEQYQASPAPGALVPAEAAAGMYGATHPAYGATHPAYGADLLGQLRALDERMRSVTSSSIPVYKAPVLGPALLAKKNVLTALNATRDRLIATGRAVTDPEVVAVESRFRAEIMKVLGQKLTTKIENALVGLKKQRDKIVATLGQQGFANWESYGGTACGYGWE